MKKILPLLTRHEYGRDGKKLPYLVLCTVCNHEWYRVPKEEDPGPECSWCAEEERGKISPTGCR